MSLVASGGFDTDKLIKDCLAYYIGGFSQGGVVASNPRLNDSQNLGASWRYNLSSEWR